MDIVKSPKPKSPLKKIVAPFVVLTVVGVLLWKVVNSSRNTISFNDLRVGTVQHGTMNVKVNGYGILRSKQQMLLTAHHTATVEKIFLRAGDEVTKDSVIMVLNNPELEQELDAVRISLSKEKANLRTLILTHQQLMLAEKSELSKLNTELKAQQLKENAEKQLVGSGVVSNITYQTTKLNFEQLKLSVELKEQAIGQRNAINAEVENIQKEQINELKGLYDRAQERVNRLTIRAGLDGTVQRMPVELGQSVLAGEELALVASDDDLIALIKISQSRAQNLKNGQSVNVKAVSELMKGKIRRIAPQVTDGTIEVEVEFDGPPPPSARPELNVDAEIVIATLENTLFIERPENAQSFQGMQLLKLDGNKESASNTFVEFGEVSDNTIQILAGAVPQDEFILNNIRLNAIENKLLIKK